MSALAQWDLTIFKGFDSIKPLKAWCKKYCKKWAFQLEDGTEIDPEAKAVTEHLQCRISLVKKIRQSGLIKLLAEDFKGAHVSPTSQGCTKDFNYVLKGKAKAGPYTDKDPEEEEEPHNPAVEDAAWQPRPFQAKIEKMVKDFIDSPEADKWKDRKVHWIIDQQGGAGKSWLRSRLSYKKLATWIPVMEGDKLLNFIHSTYRGELCFIIDIPRSQPDKHLKAMCAAMESLKDGMLWDWRHKGKRKQIVPPMIVVFANQGPPTSFLTADRWNVIHLVGHDFMTQDEINELIDSIPELNPDL